MGNIRISGPTIKELPFRFIARRIGGNEYERRWWGLAASVSAFNPPGNPDEVSLDQREGSAVAIKTAKYTGQLTGAEEAVETMTLDFSDETLPIAQNPTFIDLDVSTIRALNKGGAATNELEQEYTDCLDTGAEQFRAQLPIVNWTRTVSVSFQTPIDLSGIGAIWTTGDAVDAMGAPILFAIPVANIAIGQDTADKYRLGWYKKGSVDYTGDGKIMMKICFAYGLWRASLYPAYTPPT